MKKLLPLLILTSLLFSGCSIGGMSKKDLFQKKQECAKYKEKFEKNSGDSILEIFYSRKINSCVVYYFRSEAQFYFLQDLLTNKEIASSESIVSCTKIFKNIPERQAVCFSDKKEFEKTLKDLKGE